MKLDEKWVLNVKFDNNKVKWDDESGSDDDLEETSRIITTESLGHMYCILPKYHCGLTWNVSIHSLIGTTFMQAKHSISTIYHVRDWQINKILA